MNYRWNLKEIKDTNTIESLAKSIFKNSSPTTLLIASLLVQRGITSFEQAKDFFRPQLENLHDPFSMKDMEKATQRILKAIEKEEYILIYGDYDVDGTTSVSLVYSFLSKIYDKITYYIPDRYKEGYGVSFRGIDYAYDNNISLIITLDCGIKAVEKVNYASEKGIDFVICDHHQPADELPNAYAILNPKQIDCQYPYKELCGCGVGFKLIQALAYKLQLPETSFYEYLDWVALATIADIVPITGENRIFVYHGLQKINDNPSLPINILTQKLTKNISVSDLVFNIAPRINAAGRMKHGELAVQFLTEKKEENIIKIAHELELLNQERKEIDEKITEEALISIKNNNEEQRKTTIVFNPNWHKGVIGIVASRLIETYYRPTIVFTQSENKLVASARSISGFNIYQTLELCKENLEQFGGHKYAAGLTISPDKYNIFKQHFEEIVTQNIDNELLIPEIKIDAEINLEDITYNLYNLLKQFAPFGPQNMTPIFLTKNVFDAGSRRIGEDLSHLRLVITNQQKTKNITGIGFNLGDKLPFIQRGKPFDIVYSIDENIWNGNSSIQLRIRDIKTY